MKTLLNLFWMFFFSLSFGYGQPENLKKVLLFEGESIKLILHHYLKANLSDSEWLKLEIKNKLEQSIFIDKAEYHIDQEIEYDNGDKRIKHGAFGQNNKFGLFHFYYDLEDPSSHRLNPEITPNTSLFAWKGLTNYASVRIAGISNMEKEACGFFNINLTYLVGEKEEKITCSQKQFCFQWKHKQDVPQKKLVKRLKEVIKNPHHRWVNSYVTSELMNEPKIVAKLRTDEFINGVLSRKNVMGDEVILFLKELKNRKSVPNKKLTEHFRSKILSDRSDVKRELLFYWDNELINDLINSKFYWLDVSHILEVNSKYWSTDLKYTEKIYNYLKTQIDFKEENKPDSSQLIQWSNDVKFLAVSRSKEFLKFIKSYLDNETLFEIDVFADKKGLFSSSYTRVERETIKIPVRICDVAFIALLRATSQLDFKMHDGMRNIVSIIEIKKDVLDKDFISFFKPLANDFYMYGFEEHLKLTPDLKEKILKLIK